jgi:hypothetical protein
MQQRQVLWMTKAEEKLPAELGGLFFFAQLIYPFSSQRSCVGTWPAESLVLGCSKK